MSSRDAGMYRSDRVFRSGAPISVRSWSRMLRQRGLTVFLCLRWSETSLICGHHTNDYFGSTRVIESIAHYEVRTPAPYRASMWTRPSMVDLTSHSLYLLLYGGIQNKHVTRVLLTPAPRSIYPSGWTPTTCMCVYGPYAQLGPCH